MLPNGYEILTIPAFIIGVGLLYKGSDLLVDGTVKTATYLGISTLIISVLLVGFGTSAPEFAISVGAAIQNKVGSAGISFGNIVGSCIANLLLVLGISSLIRPIKIQSGIIRREVPIMFGATIILVIFSFLGLLDTYHLIGGILFLLLFILFVRFFINCAKKERKNEKQIDPGKITKNIIFSILGIAGVVLGAVLLIESAETIANALNIPAFIIAVSLVAIGTSLPELVVSSVAAYRGEADIAVGNVLGSNVFNILLILGFAALFIPLGAIGWGSEGTLDDIIILLAVSLIMFPILCTKHTISRFEGVFMLIIYGVFVWYTYGGSEIVFSFIG
jgi:cation:H+ antiporter